MNKFIRLLTIIVVILFSMPAWSDTPQKIKKVTNAEQFLAAIANDTRIVIPAGTNIMLTEALEDEALIKKYSIVEMPSGWPPDYKSLAKKPTLKWDDNFDGPQLNIIGHHNITIEGEGKGASIIVTPRYAFVLSFICCQNVTLKNLTLGHTEEGYCQGGVVELDHTENVVIDDCDMYGCGTEGIVTDNAHHVLVTKSIIRECSYQIMTIKESSFVTFSNCEMRKCKEFGLIVVKNSPGVVFDTCDIHDNQGLLFNISGDAITLYKTNVSHVPESIGNTDAIEDIECTWFDPEGDAEINKPISTTKWE
ncbi:MAG: right-handed parallel beta-helix repeat-containing protein [Prevotella sp.]|nr:right-handed parallel beta-helix repeat-containing protein [Prevotella sp.]